MRTNYSLRFDNHKYIHPSARKSTKQDVSQIRFTVQKATQNLVGISTILATFMFGGIAAKATGIVSNLDFSVTDQSIWSSGNGFFFSESDFIGISWNETLNTTVPIPNPPPFPPIPPTSLTVNGNTTGRIGLEYDFTISSGVVNIDYPVETTLKFPELVEQNDTITLNSSFEPLEGALLETFGPRATAKLLLPFVITADINGSVDPPLLPSIPFAVVPSIDINETQEIFNVSTTNPSFDREFGDFGSIHAHIPVVDTSDGLNDDGILASSGQDDFIELSVDVDEIVSTLIPQVPDLGGDLEIPNPFSDDIPLGNIAYDLVDVDAFLRAGLNQAFEFDPGLTVKYSLENGQEFTVNVGESIAFPTPANVGESLEVTATYSLEENLFTNNTGIVITPGLELSALLGTIEVLGVPLIDFGPVFGPRELSASFPPIPVFSNEFPLEGFQTFEETFEIPIVSGKDFGDALDSYRTRLASDGPRYLEGELQRLGADWDREDNGQPTLLANGDDMSLFGGLPNPVDDEDGVIFGDSWVDVIFNIARPGANLYQLRAWWDLDRDGCFDHVTHIDPNCDSNELFIDDLLTLEPGIFTKRYNLAFNPQDHLLYSRFRLTWDPLDLDVKPYGEVFSKAHCNSDSTVNCVSHGEVEDYVHVPEPRSIFGTLAIIGIALTGSQQKKKPVFNA